MYVWCQIALIVFCLSLVSAAALIAGRLGGNWRAFARGAAFITVSSFLGGLIGGVLLGLISSLAFHQTYVAWRALHPIAAVIPGVFAGAFEEAARIIAVRRGVRNLSYRLGQVLMFGAGFGGAEVIFRMRRPLLVIITKFGSESLNTPLTPIIGQVIAFSAILAAEIYVFHICMTVVAYRICCDDSLRARARILFPLMVAYHSSLNFIAGCLNWADATLLYGLLFWSILTPLHVIVAVLAIRRPLAPVTEAAGVLPP